MEALLTIVIVMLSVIFHEAAHGFVADWLGDPTARYSGRLTLNPIPHIDPIGSIAIPGILALSGSPFLIGWAKPVPYNPYNLRNERWGEALIGAAGPATNFLIALFFGVIIRFAGPLGLSGDVVGVCVLALSTNLVLAFYNLIPIPPLDGSKVLKAILPGELRISFMRLEQSLYALGPIGLILVSLVAIYLLWPFIVGLVTILFRIIVGV